MPNSHDNIPSIPVQKNSAISACSAVKTSPQFGPGELVPRCPLPLNNLTDNFPIGQENSTARGTKK